MAAVNDPVSSPVDCTSPQLRQAIEPVDCKIQDLELWNLIADTTVASSRWAFVPGSADRIYRPEAFDYPHALTHLVNGFFDGDTYREGFRDLFTSAWLVSKLLHQIQRDLKCIDITVNGKPYEDLVSLLNQFIPSKDIEEFKKKLSALPEKEQDRILTGLCCLQQGIAAVCIEAMEEGILGDEQHAIMGAPIAGKRATRISMIWSPDEWNVVAEQDLRVIQNDDVEKAIPIAVILRMNGENCLITWRLDAAKPKAAQQSE
jgi:hypothetical protein